MPKQHTYEQIAEDLADFADSMVEALVGATMEGRNAPFSPRLPKEQQMEYYRWLLSDPNRAVEFAATFGPDVISAVFEELDEGFKAQNPHLAPLLDETFNQLGQAGVV
jgi:hypothetical protein